jgi:hypothetical protein
MAMHPPKRLPAVLAPHAEAGRLKEAFDRVNAMRDTRTYDRTTLPRWLSGDSTPSDEKFIKALADELGRPEILSAWADDRCGTNREVRDVLTRFRGLSADHKRDVRALINESFRDDSATRTAFSMRIELRGGLTEHCHRLDLSLGWVGRLPARASVVIASDEENLVEAYTRDECIFRELVPVGSEKLASAMAALRGRKPALSYKAIDSHTFERARIQDDHEDGQIYQFDNKEVPVAEIQLTASLPYPADLTMYPVMLGAYAVAGRAEITMVADPKCAERPQALRFLGQAPSWEFPGGFDESELSVKIGENDSLIEQNSGVVFFWHAAHIGSDG